MLSAILSFAGWSYLPDWVTRQLLPIFHRFYRSVLKRNPPPPNHPLYWSHYRYVYAFTVVTYLCWNFHEAAASLDPNFYELLGVTPSADENTLKAAFRQFARKNHPDRVGPQGGQAFMEVRDAFEALKNPVTRFAYDRFGPDVLNWKHCTTLGEYVRHGLMQASGFHIASVCVLLLWSFIAGASSVTYWRYLLFASVLVYEMLFILGPSPLQPADSSLSSFYVVKSILPTHTTFFTFLWPRRVAYQHIRFLHSLFLFMSVALSRVAPVLFPASPDISADLKRVQDEVHRLGLLAKLLDSEICSQIQTELHSMHGPQTNTAPTDANPTYVPPLKPAEEVLARLATEMEDMVLEAKLRDNGPLKSAVDGAIARRTQGERRHLEHRESGIPSPTPSPPREFGKGSSRTVPFPHEMTVKQEEDASGNYIRGRSHSY